MAKARTAEPTKILSFDDIKTAEQRSEEPETVYIPAWGGNIRVRALKVAELDRINALCTDPTDGDFSQQKQQALIVQESLVEPKLDFGQAQQLISDFRAAAVKQLWQAVNRANGLGPEAIDEADKSV